MGGAHLAERQHAADRNDQLVVVVHVGEPSQLRGIDVNDEIIRAHAPFLRQLHIRPRHRGDDDAAGFDEGDQLILQRAADRVDHRVGAPREVRDVTGLGVDHLVRAEAAHIVGVAVADRGDDVELFRPRQLHRIGADIAGAAVDDDGLAFAQRGVIEQHLPCHHADHRHRRGLDMRQRRRLFRDHARRNDGVFGVAHDEKRVGSTEHLIARREAGGIGADLFDDAGDFGTQRQRRRQRQAALAGAHQGIPRPDAGGAYPYQDLQFLRLRHVDTFERNDLRRSELVYSCRRHDLRQSQRFDPLDRRRRLWLKAINRSSFRVQRRIRCRSDEKLTDGHGSSPAV